MLDGTGWAAAEIVVFMLIATLIGLVIGWILGRWVLRSNIGGEYESELEAAWDQVKVAETKLADLQAELDESQLEAKAHQASFAGVSGKLDKAEAIAADVEAAKAELADRDVEVARLAGELEARSGLEAELESVSGVVAERDAEVARLTAGLDSCQVERTALEEELNQVRADLAASAARVEALAGDLTTTIAAAPAAALVDDVLDEEAVLRMSPTEEAAGAVLGEVMPTREQGLERIVEIAERTASSGPRADDDLKQVHGIGPKLERTLKDFGITSFRQIANFHPEDIAYVTAALGAFKGRIERDDWMSSAAEEHEKKYGEPA